MNKRNLNLNLNATTKGLSEKIELINHAIKFYEEAEQLIAQANAIQVEISIEGVRGTKSTQSADTDPPLVSGNIGI